MKRLRSFLEHSDIDSKIPTELKNIFKTLKGFEIDINYEKLSDDIEFYIDIDGYSKNWDKAYIHIEEAIEYVKSLGGKLHNLILSDYDSGDEVVKKTVDAAKKYSDKKDITTIRVWFEI